MRDLLQIRTHLQLLLRDPLVLYTDGVHQTADYFTSCSFLFSHVIQATWQFLQPDT